MMALALPISNQIKKLPGREDNCISVFPQWKMFFVTGDQKGGIRGKRRFQVDFVIGIWQSLIQFF